MKKNDSLNKFTKLLYIELGAAALFSLLTLNFSLDISLLAFPMSVIFTGLLIYFAFFKFLRQEDGKYSFISRKMTEYLPFVLLIAFILRRAGKNGTAYWYDLITVILWFVVFFLSFVIASKLNDKHIMEFASGFKTKPVVDKKYFGLAKVGYEAAGWIDAFVQAIFTVLIFQIFVIQFYEIPSESMVSTFLVKDKVAVSKLECGPKFPLTDVGLPDLRKYKRGDTIVLRNPHYSMDRKSEVKTVTSQLINMLTLMTVNLNKDEDGELKADPLVKRITGVPGEQLVMQDGTLYAKTKDHDFTPVELDEKFATWDLSSIKPSLLGKVQEYPLAAVPAKYSSGRRINTKEVVQSSKEQYERMLDFEAKRRGYDLAVAEFNANEIVNKFNKLAYSDNLTGKFEKPSMFEYQLFRDVQNITGELMCKEGGKQWFADFMLSWIPSKNEMRDIYSEANFRLNVMSKITLGNLIVRYAELYRNNINASLWDSDEILRENYLMAEDLNWYIQVLLDERNMPVFPANDADGNAQFIPKNCYFMMGDNRFNSFDLRHTNDQDLKALSPSDPLSVEYYSMIGPQYINKKYIVGKPFYIFWPTGRIGKIK